MKTTLYIINGVMVLMLVFILTSSRAGLTYGAFTSTSEATSSIGICPVFPQDIEALLGQWNDHIRQGNAAYASIAGSAAPDASSPSTTNLEASSDEQLQELKTSYLNRLAGIPDELQSIASLKAVNEHSLQTVQEELGAAGAVLGQLENDVNTVDANCLRVNDTSLLAKFGSATDNDLTGSPALHQRAEQVYEALASDQSGTVSRPGEQPQSNDGLVADSFVTLYDGKQAALDNASGALSQLQSNLQARVAGIDELLASRAEAAEQAKAAAEQSADEENSSAERPDAGNEQHAEADNAAEPSTVTQDQQSAPQNNQPQDEPQGQPDMAQDNKTGQGKAPDAGQGAEQDPPPDPQQESSEVKSSNDLLQMSSSGPSRTGQAQNSDESGGVSQ
ncbi:hypothetical protein GZH47_12140 [Paenibacillus rhizovicinus]|uniref:Uncharacterized protein n=1 Tax=Paenibacillus rhizovicinus TaxID=2704463 RepID=A0A6C0NZ69_9BACL|nr:hypothetical protein [Paenibacillus rhizovicinus]QHW31518.1 hypothetical protein GZH47_12140 [Paenibacillus rhizovicinus]